MPVGVSCFVLLFCTVVYVHCDVVLVALLLLPFFALLCVPSVLISVLYSVWRLGKGTLIARVRICWNEMGSFVGFLDDLVRSSSQ